MSTRSKTPNGTASAFQSTLRAAPEATGARISAFRAEHFWNAVTGRKASGPSPLGRKNRPEPQPKKNRTFPLGNALLHIATVNGFFQTRRTLRGAPFFAAQTAGKRQKTTNYTMNSKRVYFPMADHHGAAVWAVIGQRGLFQAGQRIIIRLHAVHAGVQQTMAKWHALSRSCHA